LKKFFITGVDTDIGKTFVSMGICAKLSLDSKTGYYKPFQSGAYKENNDLMAPDVVEIKKYIPDIKMGYSYLLEGEVSPYMASNMKDMPIDINKTVSDIVEFSFGLDSLIVEGAGGFYCPITEDALYSDFIKILQNKTDIETLIVTTPDLGRINHTLMTLKCAYINDINVKGIIINKMPKNPDIAQKNFISELKSFTDIEILGVIPQIDNISKNDLIEIFKDINL